MSPGPPLFGMYSRAQESDGPGSSSLHPVPGDMQSAVIFSNQKDAGAFSDALAPFFDAVDDRFCGPSTPMLNGAWAALIGSAGHCRSISLFENDRLTPHIRWATGNRVTPEKVGELVRRLDEDRPAKESEFIDSLGSGHVRMSGRERGETKKHQPKKMIPVPQFFYFLAFSVSRVSQVLLR